MARDVLILGASVRAAAQSAVRAGYAPAGADLFGDVDTRACGPVLQVRDYPASLACEAENWPGVPWMYTGALENHPERIEQISAGRTLWGNDALVVGRVRDPSTVAAVLADHGIAFPETRTRSDRVPRDGSWLRKAACSAGGMHVDVWDHDCSQRGAAGRNLWQRRIAGRAVSGVFVGNRHSAELLGITTQQTVNAEQGDFRYLGSTTVVDHFDTVAEQFQRVGGVLAAELGLVGLFGVDAAFDAQTVWPLEINPRYTASVEVVERATGEAAIALHVAACADGHLTAVSTSPPALHVAKHIYYAEQSLTVGPALADWAASLNADRLWPAVADIPEIGTKCDTHQPVVTLLTVGESEEELRRQACEWLEALQQVTRAS